MNEDKNRTFMETNQLNKDETDKPQNNPRETEVQGTSVSVQIDKRLLDVLQSEVGREVSMITYLIPIYTYILLFSGLGHDYAFFYFARRVDTLDS